MSELDLILYMICLSLILRGLPSGQSDSAHKAEKNEIMAYYKPEERGKTSWDFPLAIYHLDSLIPVCFDLKSKVKLFVPSRYDCSDLSSAYERDHLSPWHRPWDLYSGKITCQYFNSLVMSTCPDFEVKERQK